jgi:hypothetical protein
VSSMYIIYLFPDDFVQFGQGCDPWPLCPNFWFRTPAKLGVTLIFWHLFRTISDHKFPYLG